MHFCKKFVNKLLRKTIRMEPTNKSSLWKLPLVAFLTLLLTSCLKEGDDTIVLPLPDGRIPYSVISRNLQDSLTTHGFQIHEGLYPPTVAGSYLIEPMSLDFASDQAPASYVNLMMTFSSQTQRGLLKYWELQNTDLHNIPIDGQSLEANVIGNGNDFTVYCYQNVTENSSIGMQLWRVKTATVISGTMTDTGIANCQYAYILLEKEINDINYALSFPKDSTFRIFSDGNSFAGKLNIP